jgi:hypothetical protein
MERRERRLLTTLMALGVALLASGSQASAATAACSFGCTTDCPADLEQQCQMYCEASAAICGSASWCDEPYVGYHCFDPGQT